MSVGFPALTLYLLVFVRFAAMVGFNPLLSRRNVPASVRAVLCIFLTFLVAPTITNLQGIPTPETLDFFVAVLLELFIGFAIGFVFIIFYDLLLFAGDLLDTEFGMAMAKVFDPGTNMQMSVVGKLLSFVFVTYFFLTGSHYVMIHLFSSTFSVIAPGAAIISTGTTQFIIDLFVSAFSLVMRLAIPFIAAEFVLQIALGLMMKLVPQIHVFVINFQLKQGVGLIILMMLAPVVSSFVDNFIIILLDSMQSIVYTLA